MTPRAQAKIDAARSVLVQHMGLMPGSPTWEAVGSFITLIVEAAAEEACYQMSGADLDDDREPIDPGDYRYYSEPTAAPNSWPPKPDRY